MKTFTVEVDPSTQDLVVYPGLLVSRRNGGLFVRLGGSGKASNTADIPLFKGNVPLTEERDGELYVVDAFPLVLIKGPDSTSLVLADPIEPDPDNRVNLVRFNFSVQRPLSVRGTIWPEAGEPRLVAYTCCSGSNDVWPVWYSDSIWSLSVWDSIRITLAKRSFIFKTTLMEAN